MIVDYTMMFFEDTTITGIGESSTTKYSRAISLRLSGVEPQEKLSLYCKLCKTMTSGSTVAVTLQGYNGTSWADISSVASGTVTAGAAGKVLIDTVLPAIANNIQALRLKVVGLLADEDDQLPVLWAAIVPFGTEKGIGSVTKQKIPDGTNAATDYAASGDAVVGANASAADVNAS